MLWMVLKILSDRKVFGDTTMMMFYKLRNNSEEVFMWYNNKWFNSKEWRVLRDVVPV